MSEYDDFSIYACEGCEEPIFQQSVRLKGGTDFLNLCHDCINVHEEAIEERVGPRWCPAKKSTGTFKGLPCGLSAMHGKKYCYAHRRLADEEV